MPTPAETFAAFHAAREHHDASEKALNDAAAAFAASLPEGELFSEVPVDPNAPPLWKAVKGDLIKVVPTFIGDLKGASS
jgi:hypothetical protein